MTDLRVDLIRRVQLQHACSYAASKQASGGEAHRCRCGESFEGNGALEQGSRHVAAEILAALDDAAAVA